MNVVNDYNALITKEFIANAKIYPSERVSQKIGMILQESFNKSLVSKEYAGFENQLTELWPLFTQNTMVNQGLTLEQFNSAVKQQFDTQIK
jgi:hypothetical protein